MTGGGGVFGLSFPAGRGGGSTMKASGTVSEGRGAGGTAGTGAETEVEAALGRRRRGLAALESGFCAAMPGPRGRRAANMAAVLLSPDAWGGRASRGRGP